MLTINDLKFAKNEREFVSSLFDGKSTCFGFYKKTAKRILLSDLQGNIFACVWPDMFVNARRVEGKIWTQYGLAETYKKLLAVPDSIISEREYAKQIFESV